MALLRVGVYLNRRMTPRILKNTRLTPLFEISVGREQHRLKRLIFNRASFTTARKTSITPKRISVSSLINHHQSLVENAQ